MSKNLLVELSDAIADAAERAGKSTVLVDARRRFPASGIAFAKDLILTADHVVEREEDIKVILADGTEVTARVAGRDPGTDLAVLKLDSASATPAEVSKTRRARGSICAGNWQTIHQGNRIQLWDGQLHRRTHPHGTW